MSAREVVGWQQSHTLCSLPELEGSLAEWYFKTSFAGPWWCRATSPPAKDHGPGRSLLLAGYVQPAVDRLTRGMGHSGLIWHFPAPLYKGSARRGQTCTTHIPEQAQLIVSTQKIATELDQVYSSLVNRVAFHGWGGGRGTHTLSAYRGERLVQTVEDMLAPDDVSQAMPVEIG